ncbi:MAG: serine/threonine-protein kinase, partial [Phycisphaerae bacterium]
MSEDLPSPSAEQPQELPATRSIDYPSLEQPGTEIGPYRLLEVLGEGAFGVVYLASQSSPVRRRVALKIIKPGMDSRQVLARFEAERQALAMMDHPSIARVFDAGATEKGRPYFAMELVKGVPITDYCDRHNLAVPQRLELLISACQAVQHAHQKGVIHRDIKPSNVLVTLQDGKPTPKVIDFGVAKATSEPLTERTLFTRQGQLVGTPGYMSPEQAEMSALDVDTRTDIYSLGTLLYELLTGSPPFENDELRHAGLAKIQQIIREVEPPRPSTRCSTLGDEADRAAKRRGSTPQVLARQLRGDLDWITMKALEKDRTRRYASAEAFAEDVRRHLAHQPVEAGPPSAAYRLGKFVRRHRTSVAASVTIALLLVASTAISSVLYWQAKTSERAARAAEKQQRAAEQAARASARREAKAAKEARQAADETRRAFYLSGVAAANYACETGNVAEGKRLLRSVPSKMQGWEWYHVRRGCDEAHQTLVGHRSW